MWWERWIPKSYLVKSTVCGVECVCDETNTFNYVIALSKKNKIEISDRGQTTIVSHITALAKKKSAPITIAINGKGVIAKKIIFSENDSLKLQDLVQQHFATIQVSEFYVQFYKNTNNTGHLVICRKVQVDDILQLFENEKQTCVNVFLGSLIVNAISNLTSSFNRVDSSIHQLQLINGEVDSLEPYSTNDKTNLSLGDIEIKPTEVVAFASCFGYLTQQQNYETTDATLLNLYKTHSEGIKLKLLLFSVIAFLFVVSCINSVIFFQKFEENHELEVELTLYESKNSQITELLENYQKKKTLIEQTGIFENKKLSVYADKIASTLPESILLRDLYFNPQTEETEEDSLVSFNNGQLIIKGNCSKSLLLNEWVNVLKSQSFVKNINLENFIYNAEGHLPNFTLKIETK